MSEVVKGQEPDPVRGGKLAGRIGGTLLGAYVVIAGEVNAASQLHPDVAAVAEFVEHTGEVLAIGGAGYLAAVLMGRAIGHFINFVNEEIGTLD